MRKKIVLCLVCLFCVSMLFGCGTSSTGDNKDPYSGQEMTENQNSSSDSSNSGNTDEGAAGGLMDGAEDMMEDIGTAFNNLIGDATDLREVDYTPLEERRGEMTEDMVAFLDLMKLEQDSPSMVMSDSDDRRTIGLTLSEMLERGVLFENHIKKYPDSPTTEAAKRFYEEIATNAITGGYDKANGVEHYYKGQAEGYIDEKSLAYYQQFVEANPDSQLAQIIEEYTELLQKSKFKITDEVEEFYHSLYNKLMAENGQSGQGEGQEGQDSQSSQGQTQRSRSMSGSQGSQQGMNSQSGMSGQSGTGSQSGMGSQSGTGSQSGMGGQSGTGSQSGMSGQSGTRQSGMNGISPSGATGSTSQGGGMLP